MYPETSLEAPVERYIDPFWFYWITLMSLLSMYMYRNCEAHRRNTRMLQEYEAFIRQSDEQLARLENENL